MERVLIIRYISLFVIGCGAYAQTAILQPADRVELPAVIDGNTAAMWADGKLHIFHSTGVPTRSKGPDQFNLGSTENVEFDSAEHKPVWFEAVWRDVDGTLYMWYHNEPGEICVAKGLTAPRIGAAVSYDNGKTVRDLGIVLESGDAVSCEAKNGFFAGGHGDFSVVPDREHNYFYFLFTNYGGARDEQGVAVARMAFKDRFQPSGAVRKYYRGEWEEPGRGGHMTPIFPAVVAWEEEDADSFWGPSVHWNKDLETFVVLLNHACCEPGWPQEGIYIAKNSDLAHPEAWTRPRRILSRSSLPEGPGYYPQVLGLGPEETDSVAGGMVRLYVQGVSIWEIMFLLDDREPEPPSICPEAASPACADPNAYPGMDSLPAPSVRPGIPIMPAPPAPAARSAPGALRPAALSAMPD